MQVYSQKSTRTTLPRSASAVSGVEFTQRSTLKAGSLPAAPTTHDAATTPKNKRGRTVSHRDSRSMPYTARVTQTQSGLTLMSLSLNRNAGVDRASRGPIYGSSSKHEQDQRSNRP